MFKSFGIDIIELSEDMYIISRISHRDLSDEDIDRLTCKPEFHILLLKLNLTFKIQIPDIFF